MASDIDVRLLRTFLTVAKTGSITSCALRLKLSQPAISQQIKRLEDLIGSPLINREDHRLTLTTSGRLLVPYAERMLACNEQMFRCLMAGHEPELLRLGLPEDIAESVLPRIQNGFRGEFPYVDLLIDTAPNMMLEARLRERQLDLALLEAPSSPLAPPSGSALSGGRAGMNGGSAGDWRRPLHWVLAPEFRLNPRRPVPLVLFAEGCPYRQAAVNELMEHDILFEITATVADWGGARTAVRAGFGVTVAPRSMPLPGLRMCPGDGDRLPVLPATVATLRRASSSYTPGGDRLAEQLAFVATDSLTQDASCLS